MRKGLFIAMFTGFVLIYKAQFSDSLNLMFRSKANIDARIESRYSFIKNEIISVTGVRLGIAYKRKLRIGGGVSWLKTNYSTDIIEFNHDKRRIDTIQKWMKLAYLCYYIDFVFHRTKHWQMSVPIQAGTGISWFQTQARYNLQGKEPKYFLLIYEPGITIQYKLFKWCGFGADMGYRFTLKNNKKIGEKLASPTYSIKFLFWPDQLFYQLLPEHKISKTYGPAEW